MIKTFRYRVKNNIGLLKRQSESVNIIWNFCNDTQKSSLRLQVGSLGNYDLNKLTAGTSKILGISSGTIQAISYRYSNNRTYLRKRYLRYRGYKNLGWVPIKGGTIKVDASGNFLFYGKIYKVFYSKEISLNCRIRDGSSFSEDSKGNWYLNLVVEIPNITMKKTISNVIGIDLGLKSFATLSNGEKIDSPSIYRKYEKKIATSQRAKKKKQTRNIHYKVKNIRSDFHHKLSTRIVKEFDGVAVGNISSSILAKTRMAKSVFDAGWSSFRNMLRYKAIAHGVFYKEVDEKFTTQICSSCGNKAEPKGVADLGIRQWICSTCNCNHDRDVNSAKNILARLGHQAPVEGV